MKKLFYVILLVIFLCAVIFSWKVWQNNVDIEPVSQQEVNHHFLLSVSWLESNYNAIENTNNPILWWMIKQAAETSGNATLINIYAQYKKNHLDTQPYNYSTPMFNELYRPKLPAASAFPDIQDYQVFFFYGTSCDKNLGEEYLIQKQLLPNFCSSHFLHPRCITHQLMGLRFMQRYRCGYEDVVDNTILALQDKVVSELTWDFRIVDAYFQRVLMLIDSGAYDRVKPVWIRNVLQAQNQDGSWDDMDTILPLGGGYVFTHTSTLPRIKKHKTDFHATAQGIWLMSLLLDKYN